MSRSSSMTNVKEASVASDYDRFVDETCTYRDPVYPVLGLAGETGEFVELVKKAWRKGAWPDGVDKVEAVGELGDIVWYVTRIAHLLGVSLEQVLSANKAKLSDRKVNGKQSSSITRNILSSSISSGSITADQQ